MVNDDDNQSSTMPLMSTSTNASMLAIKELKRKLRLTISMRISLLNEDEIRRQSNFVHERLFQMNEFKQAKRLGLYLSMANKEIDTVEILKRSLNDGKECFVPRFTPSSSLMELLQCYSFEDFQQMPQEPKWNIKQPGDNDYQWRANALETGGLDLILVPGVAFTINGLRLGHGKGYYDRWLQECYRRSPSTNTENNDGDNFQKPVTVGLAFREQIVHHIPVNEFDVKIDHVIYPHEERMPTICSR